MRFETADVSDAMEAMHEINARYQDIETLTSGNLDNATQADLVERLKKIREINGRIGQITKEWI